MNPDEIQAIVTKAAQAVEDGYVFPDQGEPTSPPCSVPTSPEAGMPPAPAPRSSAAAVTADLQAASGDLHLRLLFHEDGAVGEEDEAALAAVVGGAGAPDRRRHAAGRTPGRQHRLVEVGPVLGSSERGR